MTAAEEPRPKRLTDLCGCLLSMFFDLDNLLSISLFLDSYKNNEFLQIIESLIRR